MSDTILDKLFFVMLLALAIILMPLLILRAWHEAREERKIWGKQCTKK